MQWGTGWAAFENIHSAFAAAQHASVGLMGSGAMTGPDVEGIWCMH